MISTKKSYFPVHIVFKKHLALAGREAAMSDSRVRLISQPLLCLFNISFGSNFGGRGRFVRPKCALLVDAP
jgi:hypothetical protein